MKAAYLVTLSALTLGVLCVCFIAARSYWNERKDYVRTRPAEISRHPERTRILGLAEIKFSAAGDQQGALQQGGAVRDDNSSVGPPIMAAWYAPPATTRAAVVLVHGVDAERSALLFETRRLAQAGFGVLALDLPGQGASGGKTEWGVPERRAISAAVDWLTHRNEVDPARIGAFGMSMGAYVLAQAAVIDPRLAAVVLAATPNDVVEFNWLATSRWGIVSQYPCYWALRAGGTPIDMLPKDILGRIAPRPLLLVQGDQDPLVPEWMAHQLYAAAREPKELYIVRGAHHADYSSVAPAEYGARLVEFYRRALTPDGSESGATGLAPTASRRGAVPPAG